MADRISERRAPTGLSRNEGAYNPGEWGDGSPVQAPPGSVGNNVTPSTTPVTPSQSPGRRAAFNPQTFNPAELPNAPGYAQANWTYKTRRNDDGTMGGVYPTEPLQHYMRTGPAGPARDSDSAVRVRRIAENLGASHPAVITGLNGRPYAVVLGKFDQDKFAGQGNLDALADHIAGTSSYRAADGSTVNGYFPGGRADVLNAIATRLGLEGADQITPEVADQFIKHAVDLEKSAWELRQEGNKRAINAVSRIREDLIGDDPQLRVVAAAALGTSTEMLSRVYGREAAARVHKSIHDQLISSDPAVVQEGLKALDLTQEHVRQLAGSAGGIAPEANTPARAGMPYLKDLPIWGHAAGIAAAGLGGGALAMHLMAQGQQQNSASEYAQAVQALNAY